jgi:hypothetical protein
MRRITYDSAMSTVQNARFQVVAHLLLCALIFSIRNWPRAAAMLKKSPGSAVADGQGDVAGVVAAAIAALEGRVQADPLASLALLIRADVGLRPGVAAEALHAAPFVYVGDPDHDLRGNAHGSCSVSPQHPTCFYIFFCTGHES